MSVNKYNASTGELTSLAGGTRTWIGTKAAYEAQKTAGTLPNDCLIILTNDEEELAQEVTEDDPRAVTSGAVFDAIKDVSSEININSYNSFETVYNAIKSSNKKGTCNIGALDVSTIKTILPAPSTLGNYVFCSIEELGSNKVLLATALNKYIQKIAYCYITFQVNSNTGAGYWAKTNWQILETIAV